MREDANWPREETASTRCCNQLIGQLKPSTCIAMCTCNSWILVGTYKESTSLSLYIHIHTHNRDRMQCIFSFGTSKPGIAQTSAPPISDHVAALQKIWMASEYQHLDRCAHDSWMGEIDLQHGAKTSEVRAGSHNCGFLGTERTHVYMA